jgi:hypothetical protein
LTDHTPHITNPSYPLEVQSKEKHMALVDQAFELIQDSLEDHELEGFYLFNIARCGIKLSKL